jgi:hypothetical protein
MGFVETISLTPHFNAVRNKAVELNGKAGKAA